MSAQNKKTTEVKQNKMTARPLDKMHVDAYGLVQRKYGRDAELHVMGNNVRIVNRHSRRIIKATTTSGIPNFITVYQRLGLL